MKSTLSLTLIVCLVGSALPVTAREQSETVGPFIWAIARKAGRLTAPNTESRYRDARLVTAEGRERVHEVEGVLVSDPQARRIRFEVNDRAVFDVPYDHVTAIHYEESKYPNRSSCYLTVHYSDAADQGKVETIRLSKPDVSSALGALESDTGLQIDRSAARGSFLGLPIYLAVGDTVYVTDEMGQRVKGTMTQLSRSSLRLGAIAKNRSAVQRDFDQASIRKVELTNLATHKGFGFGFLGGFVLALLLGTPSGGLGPSPVIALGSATAVGLLGNYADRQRTREVYRAP